MAKAGEVTTFLKDIAALSTESLRLNKDELAETKEMRKTAAVKKEATERLAIEMRRERLLRGFKDPKKMGMAAVKAPFKAIEGIRETTRWFKNSILGTTTKAFFGLMTKSISLGFAGFAGALKGIGRGTGYMLGGAMKMLGALGGPLLAGIGMLLGPMGIGLAAIGFLGYNILKSYSGKPEEQLMAHFGINKEDIKLSHRMGFGFDQAIGGIAGLIDSFMRSMGFQSNLKDKYMGLGIGDTIQSFMSQFDTHLGFIDETIRGMFEKGGFFSIIENMILGTKEMRARGEREREGERVMVRVGGLMGEGGLIDILSDFFKEGSYFDKIIKSWTMHINPAIKQFYTDIIEPFLPEITGKEISEGIKGGTATFFMGDEQTPGSIRNMLKNLGAGIKGASEFVATLFWGEKEYTGQGTTKRSGKGLFGFMGRVGSGFSSAWEDMEFKNFNKLMAVLFGEDDGKKGILQELGEAFQGGVLKADYENIFTILFKSLDSFAGVLLELPYWFNTIKDEVLRMTGFIGEEEFEARSAYRESGRVTDPEQKKALEKKAIRHAMKAIPELADEMKFDPGSLKDIDIPGLGALSSGQYLTGVGMAAGGLLAATPIGWGVIATVALGAGIGFLFSELRDMLVNTKLPQKDLKRGLNALVKIAKEIKSNPKADTNQKRSADNLINLANMILKNIHHMPEIREEDYAKTQVEKKSWMSKKELKDISKLSNIESEAYFRLLGEGSSHADAIKAAHMLAYTNKDEGTSTQTRGIEAAGETAIKAAKPVAPLIKNVLEPIEIAEEPVQRFRIEKFIDFMKGESITKYVADTEGKYIYVDNRYIKAGVEHNTSNLLTSPSSYGTKQLQQMPLHASVQ